MVASAQRRSCVPVIPNGPWLPALAATTLYVAIAALFVVDVLQVTTSFVNVDGSVKSAAFIVVFAVVGKVYTVTNIVFAVTVVIAGAEAVVELVSNWLNTVAASNGAT